LFSQFPDETGKKPPSNESFSLSSHRGVGPYGPVAGKGKKQQRNPENPVNPVKKEKPLAEKTIEDILLHFGESKRVATKRYREFVEKGIKQGTREDLQGGGLVRSAGGETAGLLGRAKEEREKGDARILGSGDFVTEIMNESNEVLENRQQIPIEQLANKVIQYFGIKIEDISRKSQKSKISKARAIICYFAIREMRYPGTAVGKFLKIRRYSALRCAERGKKLLDTDNRLWELMQIK